MEIWEDQEIRFDLSSAQMKVREGEEIIDKLDFIEDTKGNNGEKGRMLVTSLRVIWHSLSIARISLSIGYNTIQNISTRTVTSRLKGLTDAMHILAKYNNIRYEFIFTNLLPGNFRHFTSVMGVYKAYSSSRVYRELKLRGAFIKNKQLKFLQHEHFHSKVDGVWNLSSDQGNLGTFIITNVRLVWFAEMNESFNISLPYVQMASIRIRDSKFGPALVVESSLSSGGYVLGFRIDPKERLNNVTKEIIALLKIHGKHPEFGIHYTVTSLPLLPEERPIVQQEPSEIDETLDDLSDVLVTYALDNNNENNADRQPAYVPEIGLAFETVKQGYTLKSLWHVLSN